MCCWTNRMKRGLYGLSADLDFKKDYKFEKGVVIYERTSIVDVGDFCSRGARCTLRARTAETAGWAGTERDLPATHRSGRTGTNHGVHRHRDGFLRKTGKGSTVRRRSHE